MATALRISCQAPMLRALDATGRLNWVVNFQASTLISRMLLNRARSGAKGKEATNRVMKPNWITETTDKEEQLEGVSDESAKQGSETAGCDQGMLPNKSVKICDPVIHNFIYHAARPVKNLTHLQVLIEQAQLAEVL